jgi:hypothetical protein
MECFCHFLISIGFIMKKRKLINKVPVLNPFCAAAALQIHSFVLAPLTIMVEEGIYYVMQ